MSEKLHHLGCLPEELGGYVLLPGDPKRVAVIASMLDNPRCVADSREYVTWTGMLAGTAVSVVSTGIGGPSAAIAVEELAMAGVHTIVRVGTCGALQEGLVPGTLIIPTAAIRSEGTADTYLPKAFPAVAEFTLVQRLRDAAQTLGYPQKTGLVDSKDSYYGQHRPETMPLGEELSRNMAMWTMAGALASEMECAALFVAASVRGLRAAAVLALCSNPLREKRTGIYETCFDTTRAIETAVRALRDLIASESGGAVC
ncbi:MAG: nucleoside phosphorylase [Oscillospiraceae bacterium]